MPTLHARGATLHYRTAGEGSPLVLVHGSCTDMSTWDGVVDDLARDHRVIIYDRRGMGGRGTRRFATTGSMPAT